VGVTLPKPGRRCGCEVDVVGDGGWCVVTVDGLGRVRLQCLCCDQQAIENFGDASIVDRVDEGMVWIVG
jgi:hypothetical protein